MNKLKIDLKNRTINLNLSQQNLLPFCYYLTLFNPVNINVTKKKKNYVAKYLMRRSTKLEQASAVIIHITKVNRAFNCGLTVQPYIVIVGNIEELNSTISFYTVINDIYYMLETPINALDICFKSFYLFDLEYPQEVEQLLFIDIIIPRNKIDVLINDVQDFIDLIVSVFKSRIDIFINKCGDTYIKHELSVILCEIKILSAFTLPFTQDLKHLKNLGVLIHPKEIVIGHRLGDKLVNERVIVEPIDVKIYSIPLRDILQKMLEHLHLLDVVFKYTENMKSSHYDLNNVCCVS
ncbi:hypothetical protein AGLY_014377, partial [Aphis glycines]